MGYVLLGFFLRHTKITRRNWDKPAGSVPWHFQAGSPLEMGWALQGSREREGGRDDGTGGESCSECTEGRAEPALPAAESNPARRNSGRGWKSCSNSLKIEENVQEKLRVGNIQFPVVMGSGEKKKKKLQ